MARRKLFTAVLAGSIVAAGIGGACRDQALTVSSSVGDPSFAANIRVAGGDEQTGVVSTALASTISVKVVDAGGTPVAGASVNWTVRLGGGAVIPPTGISDTAGIVSATWTLGTAPGENAVRAYLVNGYAVDSVNFTATGVIGPVLVMSRKPARAPVAMLSTRAALLADDRRFQASPSPDPR